MTNPAWLARRGGGPEKPFALEDAQKMTFLHRVTKEKVKGLVRECPLLQEAKRFLRAVSGLGLPTWVKMGVVSVGFAVRCAPWLRHAAAFLKKEGCDIFEL
eukprot:1354791-Pyramimonas_sp.AAC.1